MRRAVSPDDIDKMRALAADGRTCQDIVATTGWSERTVYRHTTGLPKYPSLPPRTPEQIARQAAQQRAAQNEVDPVAVERILAGNPPKRATRGERQAAVTKLTAAGWSAGRIANRTRMSERTVQRLRARNRT